MGYPVFVPFKFIFISALGYLLCCRRRTSRTREELWSALTKAAKTQGVKFGRKQSIDREKFMELVESGKGATVIAKTMKIGRSTVYKLLKELK